MSWIYVKWFKSYGADTKTVNTQRTITSKVGTPESWFMCSAHRLLVFNVCEPFHENVSSDFKVMELKRKLLTHKGQLLQSRKTRVMVHVFCTSSYSV